MPREIEYCPCCGNKRGFNGLVETGDHGETLEQHGVEACGECLDKGCFCLGKPHTNEVHIDRPPVDPEVKRRAKERARRILEQ